MEILSVLIGAAVIGGWIWFWAAWGSNVARQKGKDTALWASLTVMFGLIPIIILYSSENNASQNGTYRYSVSELIQMAESVNPEIRAVAAKQPNLPQDLKNILFKEFPQVQHNIPPVKEEKSFKHTSESSSRIIPNFLNNDVDGFKNIDYRKNNFRE